MNGEYKTICLEHTAIALVKTFPETASRGNIGWLVTLSSALDNKIKLSRHTQ
jgi:hypothetical protein